jgi:hypothetical protein
MIFWVIFFIWPVYMTLLMTVWYKSKFIMLCKHVIVYCGWHVWLQSAMTAWGHKLKVRMSCIFFIFFILHAYLVCITILALHFILLNKINLYYDVHTLPLLTMTVSYFRWSLYPFVDVSIVRPVMFFCRSVDFLSPLWSVSLSSS